MKKYLCMLFSLFLFTGCQKWDYTYFNDVQPVLVWAEDIGTAGFHIYWTESSDPYFDHYSVLMRKLNDSFYYSRGESYHEGPETQTIRTTKDRSETVGTIQNLDPGTNYYFVIRVYTVYDTYADSNILHITTLSE